MSWFPVDDAFHSHPKARKAGDEAVGMWARGGSHCMAYLTDGFVADWWVKEQPRGVAKARRLIAADLWSRSEKDGETGYQFHDWKPECMKAHVLAVREKARQRKAKQRESQQESRVTDGVSPASCLVPTQPNPTQPINSVVDMGGDVTQIGEYKPPPLFCPKHPHGTDENCWACGERRKQREAWSADLDSRRAELKRELAVKHFERIANCPMCDEFGDITFDDSVRRCSHQETAHA